MTTTVLLDVSRCGVSGYRDKNGKGVGPRGDGKRSVVLGEREVFQ